MAQFVARRIVLRSSFLVEEWWHVLFLLALSLKLRLVPLHSWVIDIFRRMSLIECFILRVVSKIRPLLILLYWAPEWSFNLGIISILWRSFMGIIYRDLRHILRCSSIIGTRWLCVAASYRVTLFTYSFIFYTLSNLILFWSLDQMGTYNLSDGMVNLIPSYKMKMIVSFILIRNVGLPIFLFFMVKLLVIVETKWYFLILLVLLLRRISIVWYARCPT
jgi:NADH-quinone oxidoreductase subunit N